MSNTAASESVPTIVRIRNVGNLSADAIEKQTESPARPVIVKKLAEYGVDLEGWNLTPEEHAEAASAFLQAITAPDVHANCPGAGRRGSVLSPYANLARAAETNPTVGELFLSFSLDPCQHSHAAFLSHLSSDPHDRAGYKTLNDPKELSTEILDQLTGASLLVRQEQLLDAGLFETLERVSVEAAKRVLKTTGFHSALDWRPALDPSSSQDAAALTKFGSRSEALPTIELLAADTNSHSNTAKALLRAMRDYSGSQYSFTRDDASWLEDYPDVSFSRIVPPLSVSEQLIDRQKLWKELGFKVVMTKPNWYYNESGEGTMGEAQIVVLPRPKGPEEQADLDKTPTPSESLGAGSADTVVRD